MAVLARSCCGARRSAASSRARASRGRRAAAPAASPAERRAAVRARAAPEEPKPSADVAEAFKAAGVEGASETDKMMAQMFGSNLQVAVWVVTLTTAGLSGYNTIKDGDMQAGGFFLAPPFAAAILIFTFGVFFTVKRSMQTKDIDMSEFE